MKEPSYLFDILRWMPKRKRINQLNKILNLALNNWDKIILSFLIAAYTTVLGTLSILRHNAFASNFDLSNMDQTLWFTLNGHFFSLRLPEEIVSRFAVHADIILVLLSPLYLVWDDVRILLLSQTVFLALGAIPAYLLSLKLIKNKIISLAIVIAYLLNPGMQWTNIYDFHAVSLAIPLFIAAFYFAYTKKWKWYAVMAILAILTKEQISLNVALLGVYVAIFRNRTIGIATTLIGITWFVAMVFIVMPYFSPNNAHWVFHQQGETNPQKLMDKYFDPHLIIEQFILEPETIHFYRLLIEPFGYIPLIGFPLILLSAPDFFIAILMDARHINLHYESGITPAIIIATIFGFYYAKILLQKIQYTKKHSTFILYGMAFILMFFSLRNNYYYSPLPTTPSCWCLIYNVTDEDRRFEKVLQEIPEDAIVTSSVEIRPHVNHRLNSFGVPSATDSADFIALITQNRMVGNYEDKLYENELIPILLDSPNHRVKFRSKHFLLFERID